MAAYVTLTDVYDLGFGPGAFVTRPRALDPDAGDALDFSTGTFRMIAHDYRADDLLHMVLIGAGAVPTNATANTPYHPIPLDFFRFRLAATSGGSALTFADAGTGAWALQIDPERRLPRLCESMSRELDQDLTAQSTPLLPDPTTGRYHPKVVAIVSRMVARRGTAGLIFENAQFRIAKERVDAEEKRDDDQRASWRAGEPINPLPIDQTDYADNAAMAGTDRAPTAWRTGYA